MDKLILLPLLYIMLSGCNDAKPASNIESPESPIMISTWDDGKKVNNEAWQIINKGGTILDAIERGCNWIEDEINCCVGLGGNPDREGIVTLDASIMAGNGDCGSVAFVERVRHPISLARMVMERTPHVLMVGAGAQQFAVEQGITLEPNELSEQAKNTYEKWLIESKYQPNPNVENSVPKILPDGSRNHDTMASIGIDQDGKVGGGVTTSGMGFKMRGRVGDSPIIGAGLYADQEVGAATSSGVGEEVIRSVGSFLVVELMRQGLSPEEACKKTVERIVDRLGPNTSDIQVGFVACDTKGNYGAYSILKGFTYAVKTNTLDTIIKSPFLLKVD